jgi:hypothetical protein
MIIMGSSRTTTRSTFDVFQHPTKGYEAVKRGFSWPAFIFTLFWAFLKRLWFEGFIVVLMIVVIVSVQPLEDFVHRAFGNSGLGWIVSLIFGFRGNRWRKEQLETHGWSLVVMIEAASAAQALAEVRQRAGVWTEADARESFAVARRLELSGNRAATIDSYKQVIQKFPGSEAARDAEASIRSLEQL